MDQQGILFLAYPSEKPFFSPWCPVNENPARFFPPLTFSFFLRYGYMDGCDYCNNEDE